MSEPDDEADAARKQMEDLLNQESMIQQLETLGLQEAERRRQGGQPALVQVVVTRAICKRPYIVFLMDGDGCQVNSR